MITKKDLERWIKLLNTEGINSKEFVKKEMIEKLKEEKRNAK